MFLKLILPAISSFRRQLSRGKNKKEHSLNICLWTEGSYQGYRIAMTTPTSSHTHTHTHIQWQPAIG